MKILHSAPLDIEISPNLKYAGTERILLYLNQGLSEIGQTSVVAAPGNSNLGGYGKLLATRQTHLWVIDEKNRKMVRSQEAYEAHYRKVLEYAQENNFDVIHDHPGQFLFASDTYQTRKNDIEIPIVLTTHEPTIIQGERTPEAIERQKRRFNLLRKLQGEGHQTYVITLSNSHKKEYEEIGVKVDDFIYNGINLDLLPFQRNKQAYMLWLGRISDWKGTDLAVKVAKKTKRPLIIVGEIHQPFQRIYDEKIAPYLNQIIQGEDAENKRDSLLEKIASGKEIVREGEIMFFGPVNDRQKAILYQNASVTLVPNRWKEPFGLVPVESMATGTPVIVTNTGALPELVEDGKTGIIVDAFENGKINDEQIIQETIEALKGINTIDPLDCSNHVKENFGKERMTQDYLKFYRSIT